MTIITEQEYQSALQSLDKAYVLADELGRSPVAWSSWSWDRLVEVEREFGLLLDVAVRELEDAIAEFERDDFANLEGDPAFNGAWG